VVIDPVEQGPYDIPLTLVDPVEEPSTILSPPAIATTIAEPKTKRPYTKSGKYSKKPEPQRPISPLSFEGSVGIEPQFVYAEGKTNIPPTYPSPMTEMSAPTQFRSNTP
jgi:hypothetical protein